MDVQIFDGNGAGEILDGRITFTGAADKNQNKKKCNKTEQCPLVELFRDEFLQFG